jgi:serine/threonine protein kinase
MSQHRLNETSPLLRPRPKVSDFEIQELIGIGNFGTVHKAWNNKDQRECALKIIKKESVAAGK